MYSSTLLEVEDVLTNHSEFGQSDTIIGVESITSDFLAESMLPRADYAAVKGKAASSADWLRSPLLRTLLWEMAADDPEEVPNLLGVIREGLSVEGSRAPESSFCLELPCWRQYPGRLILIAQPMDTFSTVWAAYDALWRRELASTVWASDNDIVIVDPSSCAHALEASLGLVERAMPMLGRSLLRHVYVINLLGSRFDSRSRFPTSTDVNVLASASRPSIPGCVFFSPRTWSDPYLLSEALIHESAHQKLYSLQFILPLYRTGYSADISAAVVPPWHADNATATPWPADRCLSALHAYVHIAIFWLMVARIATPDISTYNLRRTAQAATSRATELAQILLRQMPAELSTHGSALATWLGSLATALQAVSH